MLLEILHGCSVSGHVCNSTTEDSLQGTLPAPRGPQRSIRFKLVAAHLGCRPLGTSYQVQFFGGYDQLPSSKQLQFLGPELPIYPIRVLRSTHRSFALTKQKPRLPLLKAIISGFTDRKFCFILLCSCKLVRNMNDMDRPTAVITGVNSGIGKRPCLCPMTCTAFEVGRTMSCRV